MIAKKLFKNVNTKNLSAVPPDPYGERFIKFMKEFVFEVDKSKMDIDRIREEITAHIKEQIATKLKEIFAKQGK